MTCTVSTESRSVVKRSAAPVYFNFRDKASRNNLKYEQSIQGHSCERDLTFNIHQN